MEEKENIQNWAKEEFNKWVFPEVCQNCGSFLITKRIDSEREYWYTCEDCGETIQLDDFEFNIDEFKTKFIESFELGFKKAQEELNSEVNNSKP